MNEREKTHEDLEEELEQCMDTIVIMYDIDLPWREQADLVRDMKDLQRPYERLTAEVYDG